MTMGFSRSWLPAVPALFGRTNVFTIDSRFSCRSEPSRLRTMSVSTP